jgi:hypothetical protein
MDYAKKVIEVMPLFASHIGSSLPSPDETQKEFISRISRHLQRVSIWLEYLVLGRNINEFLNIPAMIAVKPDADFSKATLDFCRQIWLQVPIAQQLSPVSPDILWGMCEAGKIEYLLRSCGLFGKPELISKKSCYREQSKVLTQISKSLKNSEIYELPEIKYLPFIDFERLHLALFSEATVQALSMSDENLENSCKQYQAALRLRNQVSNQADRQILRIVNGGINLSQKGRKLPIQIEKKRGRGRPPKGNKPAL